jgi:hypothetical protein
VTSITFTNGNLNGTQIGKKRKRKQGNTLAQKLPMGLFLKNTLAQDNSFMNSDESFEAWCFINHIALTLEYRVLKNLKEKGFTNRFHLKTS